MFDLLNSGAVLQGARGQYRILNVIGRGGQGAVYRVEKLGDASIWALKEMRPPPQAEAEEVAESKRLFQEEAAMLQKLQHANLPRIIDYFEQHGRPYMVMEFVTGQTLEDRQEQINAPFAKNEALGWTIQIARVFHYLHTQTPPIIFRDMKPTNVMLTNEGIIKLIDFGVARTYKSMKAKDTVAMGSPGYAPPEQYGKGQTDARSDIYALCATLVHLLTNMPPVPLQPPKPGSIIKLNPTVDTEVEKVVIKGMALKPADRYQSAHELEQALMRCLNQPFVDPARTQQVQPGMQLMPPASAQPAPPPAAYPPAASALAQAIPNGKPCPGCGRVNSAGARFCSGCGQRMEEQFEAKLVVTSPRGIWEFPLLHFPCRIGRRDPTQNHHPELDLADHDRGVASRRHAIIQREGPKHVLIDLGSVNGTSVNNLPLTPHQPYVLRPGDRIRIGEVEMVFGRA